MNHFQSGYETRPIQPSLMHLNVFLGKMLMILKGLETNFLLILKCIVILSNILAFLYYMAIRHTVPSKCVGTRSIPLYLLYIEDN